jgi:molybdate transport system substrate-binding protein
VTNIRRSVLATALAVAVAGCTSASSGSGQVTITVFAAASLSSVFPEIGDAMHKAHGDVVTRFNFAGTQTLVTQIENGAPADVFASADQAHMDSLASRVDSPVVFARNKLAVIVPATNPARVVEPYDLARPGVKLDIAAPAVPAGASARAMLAKLGAQPGSPSGFLAQALKNVVSQEDNVEAVLTRVALGEADAGIVYLSDMSTPNGQKVRSVPFPDAANVINAYPAAVVKGTSHSGQARLFLDFLTSTQGQELLRKHGFLAAE